MQIFLKVINAPDHEIKRHGRANSARNIFDDRYDDCYGDSNDIMACCFYLDFVNVRNFN